MKLLLDTCVWGGQRTQLIAAGHDVTWAGDWSEDPGDEELSRGAILTVEPGRVRVRPSEVPQK